MEEGSESTGSDPRAWEAEASAARWKHRPRVSMRIRLTLWVVSIFTVIQWSISGVLWLYQSSSIEAVFNERLRERAETVAGEVAVMIPGTDRAWLDGLAERQASYVHTEHLQFDVLGKDGRSVIPGPARFVASDIPVAAVLAGQDVAYLKLHPSDSDGSAPPLRVAALAMVGADLEPYVLVVCSEDGFARVQLALVGRLFLVSGLLGPLVTAACGWYIAGIAVAPFERLRRLASELGPQSLNKSLDMPVRNTELAELRDQLEDARVRIRNAFEVQERFMTNVSHELKTPIAVVLTEAQTLRSAGVSPEVLEFVESTEEEMQRLGRLVESFLTLARVRDGHHEPRGKRYGVNDLAMDAVEHCAKMADLHGVVLAAELLEDDQALEASVSGDPELLRTMLDNLIRNAIRFTPPGKRVDVRMEIQGGWLHVRVVDQGPGIPCDQIGAVFDRFRQGSNQQNGRAGGHGLGLAIAQGIAELHGGRIGVSESEGVGCVFEVRLPLSGRSVHANGRARDAAPG